MDGRVRGPDRPVRRPDRPVSATVVILQTEQGRTQGARRVRTPPPPWDLKNTIFSGFHPLSYVICIFEVFFYFLLCED